MVLDDYDPERAWNRLEVHPGVIVTDFTITPERVAMPWWAWALAVIGMASVGYYATIVVLLLTGILS